MESNLTGRVIDGRYRVVRILGEGGMGTVYEAEHVQVGRKLAIKTLHPELVRNQDVVARFQREARASAAVGNTHIVEIVDLGSVDGAPYIAMEYLDGPSMRQLLEEHGPLAIPRALGLAVQCCRALSAAHAKGIVHRDLKPDNVVVLDRDGADFVKIVDFGIAKLVEDAVKLDAVATTRTGVTMGTPVYMSPEQLAGASDIDARADVYAMGAVLFELITGKPPFDAPTMPMLAAKVYAEKAPSMAPLRPNVPRRLDTIVQRALAKERNDRFPTIAELGNALERLKMTPYASTMKPAGGGADEGSEYDDETIVDPNVPTLSPTSRTSTTPQAWDAATTLPPRSVRLRRRLWGVAGGAAALLVVAGGIVIAAMNAGGPDAPRPGTPPQTRPGPASTRAEVPTSPPLATTAEVLAASPASIAPTAPSTSESPARPDAPPVSAAHATEVRTHNTHGGAASHHEQSPEAEPTAAAPVPDAPARIEEQAPAARRVTIRNGRNVDVTVTLTCAGETTTVHVDAGATRSVSVPTTTCRVRCSAPGAIPICQPPRLLATDSRLAIQ